MPSWTRWKTSRSAAGERLRYSTVGERGRVASGFLWLAICWENYVLHVIFFEANIRLSSVGISARDVRVAIEVVYHHIFFVFGH